MAGVSRVFLCLRVTGRTYCSSGFFRRCVTDSLWMTPNPKGVKMDNPNEQSGSTRAQPKKEGVTKNQPKLLREGAQRFEEIVNGPAFVDHTHFIKHFLNDDLRRLAIFAPRRFGKSTHLHMVQRFLEIDIDETGEISSSVNGPAKERKNYKLFEKTRIIDDDSSKELVEAHLGRHPVIHLDLKTSEVDSVETAIKHCRQVVHNAYLDHEYLKTSTRLNPKDEKTNAEDQNICRKWCSNEMYKTQDLSDSVENLTKYLYNHCNGTKVYILVDEFDAINSTALQSIADQPGAVEKLRNICKVLTGLLKTVAKGAFSNAHVAGVLLTGVSYVCGMGLSPQLNNFKRLKFLDGGTISEAKQSESREFVPFYGATKEEVEDVINKLVKNKQLVNFEDEQEFLNDAKELDAKKIFDEVEARYNGYSDKNGVQVFCLWSVLQYLETGKAENYWNAGREIQYLSPIFKIEDVAFKMTNLVRGDTIQLERMDEIQIEAITLVFKFLKKEDESEINKDDVICIFNILMDLGYLTYSQDGGKHKKLKVPNLEIRTALLKMIGGGVTKYWKIKADQCSEIIDKITSSLIKDEKALQTTMLDLYEAIEACVRPLEGKPLNERAIVSVVYGVMGYLLNYVPSIDFPIKDARGTLITRDRPDILLQNTDKKECCILLEIKYNNNEKGRNKRTTSLYALQEARGLVKVGKKGKKRKYMEAIKKLGREEVLVIGLSVDSDMKVSFSCAVDMDKKIYFKSEKEHINFPELYQEAKLMLREEKEEDFDGDDDEDY